MSVNATVNSGYAPGTPICLTATLSGSKETGPVSNNSITVCTSIAPRADLMINKTLLSQTGWKAGDHLIYRLDYANIGGKAISGIVITDTPPAMLNASTTSWTLPALAAGATGSVFFTGTLTTDLQSGAIIVNTANIVGNGLELTMANNTSISTGVIK